MHPLVASAGTRGAEGSGLDVLQFGSVADVAVGTGNFEGSLWTSDGDGGINNRVARLDTTSGTVNVGKHPLWIDDAADSPDMFSSPHSIAFHEKTATVIVADRDNFRLQVRLTSGGLIATFQ